MANEQNLIFTVSKINCKVVDYSLTTSTEHY